MDYALHSKRVAVMGTGLKEIWVERIRCYVVADLYVRVHKINKLFLLLLLY
jgi:hypothetical protein